MEERSALVTGATGFIASHLVPALVADGWRVRACGRRPEAPWLPGAAEYRSLDLVTDPGVESLLEGVTHVFHLAGASSSTSSQEQMERDNVEATQRLFAAIESTGGGARALYMSSTSVYGEEEPLPSPVPETAQPHPSRGYGKAKWGAEQVVWRHAEAGMPVVVLRPVSVHGPGAVKLLASAILDAAIERFMGLARFAVHREPIEQRLVHVDDLVQATVHLAGHPEAPGRAFNVVSGVYPTSHEIAQVLADHFGMTLALDDDPDCGPSYDERLGAWEQMRAQGMTDDIILTKERLRFMRKGNRNNRLSIDALLGTGFRLRHTDTRRAVLSDARWYAEKGWIQGP